MRQSRKQLNGVYYANHKKEISEQKKRTREKFRDCYYNTKCWFCGTYINIQYHHKNPKEKDISVSQMLYKKESEIMEELKKCIPLCGNCHSIFHEFLTS